MERYFKRKSTEDNLSPSTDIPESSNENNIESILANLPGDLGLQLRILEYDPNIRDQHIQKCCFFFCQSCYLFKLEIPDQAGNDNFTRKGFHNWKKKCQLRVHVEGPNSAHNQALLHCEVLMNHNQHIQTIVHKQSDQARIDYRTRLNASLDCIRFLLQQGLTFRDVVFKNAPENLKLTSPDIQKDLMYAAACETTNAIMFDVSDDAFFSVLVDESRDISVKEQMTVVLCYVNTNGQVVERFVDIKHVPNTTAFSLKKAIDQFFSINGLSISRLRGQGYDGASNMQEILGITNVLSHVLQKKDLDIVSAMALVKACKQQLQQLQELNSRFNETSTKLLLCVACLSPNDSFSTFDIEKLVRLAQFYPKDFSNMEFTFLEDELKNYIFDMRLHNKFSALKELIALHKMKLALILPVATALVERVFSVLKIVKNPHRNRMGDQWLNDSLVVYIEKEVYNSINNDVII
ncbi:unnamed protein product [Malus baccata var. baccata]